MSLARAFEPARTSQWISLFLIVATTALFFGLLFFREVLPDIAVQLMVASIGAAMLIRMVRENVTQRYLLDQARFLKEKAAEAEERNRLLKLTEASAHVGHWRLDLRNDEVFWSDETARIHGQEPGFKPELDEAINFYLSEDRPIVTNAVETARATGKPFTFRARLMRSDGDIRHAESIAKMEHDADGKPVALFGVLADRTEEEAMRQQLREARDEAEEMAEAKSSFLAKMSHEIRTPLNGVVGFADLLLSSDLSETQKRHAGLIVESGRNLQTLLNDILDLSKIEAGRMQVNTQCSELADVIGSTIRLSEHLAAEKGLSLDCHIAQTLPSHVMIDALRLRLVLNNLISNALRFTDKGQIRVRAAAADDRLIITVSDTGIGIDENMQALIFDAFMMVENPETTSRGGTGLGLPICRQLAELMGGTLEVESTKGQGSCFIVDLPLIPAEPSIAQRRECNQSSSPSDPLLSFPILLAEDFDINRELILQMAKRLNVEIHEAVNGKEAVRMVKEATRQRRPYGLVLMDVQMPEMNGYEATRAIREAGIGAESLPIVALTANAFPEDIAKSKEAGMQEHLAKPLSFEKFRAVVERWLPEGTARAA